jgi:hypothetical protein
VVLRPVGTGRYPAAGSAARTPACLKSAADVAGMPPTPTADRVVRDYERRVAEALAPWTTGMILPGFCDPSAEGADRAFPPRPDRLADVKDR